MVDARTSAKRALVGAGARLPSAAVRGLSLALPTGAANYLETGDWVRSSGYLAFPRYRTRYDVFDHAARIIGDRSCLCLEFGVAKGTSLNHWARLLRHPESQLIGFDSFEGLPEDWIKGRPAGHFSTGGSPPPISDPRISYVVGWFHETLPGWEPPAHERLIVSVDCDLYSAASVVLSSLEGLLVPGSLVYFDEFNHGRHELRAFREHVARTAYRYELIAATETMANVLFRRR